MKYFKHMSNMRHDVKIRRLISKYGVEGYGVYNLILEAITEKLETESPVPDLHETCEDMAEFYNGNTARINEIANYMINQGLFELDEITGRIICSKIYKFLESSQTRSEQIRNMIKSYKTSTKLLTDAVSETVPDIYEEQNRTEQNRRRTEHKKATAYHPLTHLSMNKTTYEELTTEYGKPTVDEYFERIADYCAATGKVYKDHAATCRNWIKRDIDAGKFRRLSNRDPDGIVIAQKMEWEK